MAPLKQITQNGVYRISLDRYHNDTKLCDGPSVSSSGLRTIFSRSPKHFWSTWAFNPDRVEPKEKEAFVLGRAAHHLLLGEDDFSTLFIQRPDMLDGKEWHGNRTVCREWVEKQDRAGRTVLTPDQLEKIRGIARELTLHPLIDAGLLTGEVERSLIWRDEATGIWLKSRPDCIPNDSGDVADLKLSKDSGEDLDFAVERYRYDMQAAMTKWGFKKVLKRELQSFSFVFAENSEPYSTDVLTLTSGDIEEAEKDLRVALDTLAYCLKTGNWFGPSGTQSDARFVHRTDRAKERATFRRDFLRREIVA